MGIPTSAQAKRPTISMLWMEGPLSFLEQLCVKSFVDAGHETVLYHYGPVENVPQGVGLSDAADILPKDGFLLHQRTGSPALHSDLFRYHLLEKRPGTIWADTDAYCLKPFETRDGHFYGWESAKHVNGGVLALPKGSDTLNELLAFTSDAFAIPPWYGADYTAQLSAAAAGGHPVHAGEQPWGVWGPHALTYFLNKTGEIKYALPQEALYPFSFKDRRLMLRENVDTSAYITENTYSVHLYGRRMRGRLVRHENGIPSQDSLLGQLLMKHGIDPSKAPIPGEGKPAKKARQSTGRAASSPIAAAERYGRGQVNLTDLADRYGTDKGSKKHRYSELYQMLFLPYRQKRIALMEMGLQIGGPEHGKSADRPTSDLPSIRMWLEYFPKAQIHGLDVSDFSWFQHERFVFHRCDMGKRENLQDVAAVLPEALDIVIDDASHASHHQQNGFLELFDKVKSGGLYIVEDLRWQPREMEVPGITKTADLFQGYIKTGIFSHADPGVADAFNAKRIDISGCFIFQAQYDKKRKDQVLVVHKR